MRFEKFEHTTPRYHFWIDMNEPSVFEVRNNTMALNNLHYDDQGRPWYHKDVHNMYGALQNKAAFRGHLARD